MGKAIFALVGAILMIWLFPIIGIWAINTLFPVVAIPYTLETWAAMLVFFGLFVRVK